jgi:ABC-type phosphate transport system substrate-binding protein/tRNA A-37 threonylcarbamoyl transferase component Bud32
LLAAVAGWFLVSQWTATNVQVNGYGTTFGNLYLMETIKSYQQIQRPSSAPTIIYTNENIDDFSRINDGSATFVGVDNPMQNRDLASLTGFPIAATAIVPIVHFTSESPLPADETLVLEPHHLVGLFNGTYTRFCDIAADLNPNWKAYLCKQERGINVTVFHRTVPSGTNFVFTSALSSFSSAWKDTYGYGLDTKWYPFQTGSNVNATIEGNAAMFTAVQFAPWSIGYLPLPEYVRLMSGMSSDPHVYKVSLWMDNPDKNAQSKMLVKASTSSVKNVLDFKAQSMVASQWYYDLVHQPCFDCWPITDLSYVVVRHNYLKYSSQNKNGYKTSAEISAAMNFFLYMLSTPQIANDLSFNLPPDLLINAAKRRIEQVTYNGQKVRLGSPVRWEWIVAGLIAATTVLAASIRIAVPLCKAPKTSTGRPRSRVTKDDMYDGSNHSFMRQILESDPAITSAKPPRMEDSLRRALVDTEEIVIQQQIGKGAFGEVYMGTYIGAIVAIKRMLLPTSSERMEVVENFVREAGLMAQIRHPNIVQFLGASVSPPYLYLITEYCSQGSLHDVIHDVKKRTLGPSEKRAMLIDAALGIMYLHGKGIVHRDIKTHNFLVDRMGTVKVADFGTSAMLGFNLRATGSENNMKTMVGTPEYVAPEVVTPKGKGYSAKADIYSFGIVMWEVWSGQQPYADLQMIEIIFGVTNDQMRPPISAIDEPDLADLIQRCWAQEPERRPSFDEILAILRDLDDSN